MAPRQYESAGEQTEAGDASTSPAAAREKDSLAPRRGDLIDRYLILEPIGAGALGLVFAAYDPDLDRRIAIKILRDAGPNDQARMVREAQAIAKVTDPNVVTVHDVGVWRSRVFLAMEFVEGLSLRAWLAREKRSTAAILDVFVQAGRGLAAAHAAGIIHRDFKPDNVLVGNDGRVRVADFGIARSSRDSIEPSGPLASLHSGSHELLRTAPGSLVGTPAYMAPEQHLRVECTAAADQFSFCVALWEALFGERPFRGDTMTSLSIAVLEGKLEVPQDPRDVPRSLRDVLARGLATAPEDRHASMTVLLALLQPSTGRRARVWWAAGLVAAGTTAGFAAASWSRPQPTVSCDPSASPIAEIWNERAATAMATAFESSGVGWAPDLGRTLRGRLDRFSAAWTEAWSGHCLAQRAAGGVTDREVEARLECLDDRRRELAAAVEVLVATDASTIDGAARVVGGLRDVEVCSGDAALRSRKPAPPSDALAEVGHVRDELERAGALHRAGAERRATALIEELRERAARVGWPVLMHEVEVESLMLRDGHAIDPTVADRLRSAFNRALELDDGASAAQIACEIGWRRGYEEHVPLDGLLWIDTCDALRIQSGGDWLIELGALNHRGVLESLLDHHEIAERSFLAALEIAVAHDDIGNRVQQLRDNFGSYLGNRGLYDRAEVEYRASLEALRSVYGEVHPRVADTCASLALISARRGDLTAARGWFEQANTPGLLAVRRPITELTVSVGMAELALASGDATTAVRLLRRAVELAAFGDQGPGQSVLLRAALIRAMLREPTPDRSAIEAELTSLDADPVLAAQPRIRPRAHVAYGAYARRFGDPKLLDEAARRLEEATAEAKRWYAADALQLAAELVGVARQRGDLAGAERWLDWALALDLSNIRRAYEEATALVDLASEQAAIDRTAPRAKRLLDLAEARVSVLRGDDGRLRRQLDAARTGVTPPG